MATLPIEQNGRRDYSLHHRIPLYPSVSVVWRLPIVQRRRGKIPRFNPRGSTDGLEERGTFCFTIGMHAECYVMHSACCVLCIAFGARTQSSPSGGADPLPNFGRSLKVSAVNCYSHRRWTSGR